MGKCRVLLVEDNKINRDIATELLLDIGVDVVAADNGKSALNLVQSREDGFFDLIFMDIQMPIMNGIEATEKIRAGESEYRKNVPIVAISANIEEKEVALYLECGINDFVKKPVEAKCLAAKLVAWVPDIKLDEDYTSFDDAELEANEPKWVKQLIKSHFNSKAGLLYCGSAEVYREFLTEFVMYKDKTLDELDKSLIENRMDDFGRGVHSIKSFTASLGNEELSALSASLEKAAENNDRTYIDLNYADFKKLYKKCVDEAMEVIGTQGMDLVEDFNKVTQQEQPKLPKNVMIISNTETFILQNLLKKLNDSGIKTKFTKNSVEDLEAIEILPTLFLIIVDENFTDDTKRALELSSFIRAQQRQVVLLGYPGEMKALHEYISASYILAEYARPIDIPEFIESLDTLLDDISIVDRKKVLVVDDYGPSLRLAKTWLEMEYDVMTAESGIMAIKMLTREIPDLILLDYEMPTCNGKIVFQMLKQDEEFAKIPVMFLTGKADETTVREILKLKPAGYLLKNRQPGEIVSAIEAFFNKNKI